jgi:hypothetical protein
MRWTFHVADGAIAVGLRLELYDGDHWKHAGAVVCASYHYAQEHEQLAALKAAIERSTSVHRALRARR